MKHFMMGLAGTVSLCLAVAACTKHPQGDGAAPKSESRVATDHQIVTPGMQNLFKELDAHALSFNRKQLNATSPNELMIWFLEPMEGGIASTIFTDNGVSNCNGELMKAFVCKKSEIQISKAELAGKLRALRELKNSNCSCEDVMDGWRVTIDGVVDNERFAIDAWNPGSCDNPDAKRLHALLQSF